MNTVTTDPVQELFDSYQDGGLSGIQESIQGGADVNARNTFGETLLHKAAERGDLETTTFLLGKSAPPLPATWKQ